MSYRAVKPTYDSSRYGTWVHLPLIVPLQWPFEAANFYDEEQVTYSTAEFRENIQVDFSDTIGSNGLGNTNGTADLTRLLPDIQNYVIKETMPIAQCYFDGTADSGYNINYSWTPPQTGVIDQILINAGFAFIVFDEGSAEGTARLNNLNFTAQSYINTRMPNPAGLVTDILEPDNSHPFNTITDTAGEQIFLIKNSINNISMPIIAGSQVAFNFRSNYDAELTTDMAIVQGFLPLFSYINTDVFKPWYMSEIILHVQASPDSLDKVAAVAQTKLEGFNF